jgi:hypothetical protein
VKYGLGAKAVEREADEGGNLRIGGAEGREVAACSCEEGEEES